MASVGIHAALGVSLPYLPISSQEKPSSRTVQLVQLSPTEQSRIPQLTPPPLSNQLGSLYPLPPGLSTPYPSLPSLGSSSFFPNLPPISPEIPRNGLARTTQTPTQTQQKASTPQKPSTTQKPQPTDKNLSVYQGATRIPQPDRRGIPAGLNPVQLPYTPPPLYPPSNGNQPVVEPKTPLPAPPNNSNQQIARGLPSTSPSQPSDLNQVVKQSQSSTPMRELLGIPSLTQPSPPNISATATPPGTSVATATPPQTPAPSKPNGTGNGNGTSNDEYQRALIDRLASNPSLGKPKDLTIAGNYPKAACPDKLSGAPIVSVDVDKNGAPIADSVELLSKSGSATLDENAISMVQGMNYSAYGAPSYVVKVGFEYDTSVCASSPAPQESAKPEQSPTPQESAKPEQLPKPQESAKPQETPKPQESAKPQESPKSEKSPEG